LRKFRDARKAHDAAFGQMVQEYYAVAPKIVSRLDSLSDAKAIYESLYNRLVLPCVRLIKAGNETEAVAVYSSVYRELCAAYL